MTERRNEAIGRLRNDIAQLRKAETHLSQHRAAIDATLDATLAEIRASIHALTASLRALESETC